MLPHIYYKFTAKSVGERSLKIGLHLAKLAAQNIVAPFIGHGAHVVCHIH